MTSLTDEALLGELDGKPSGYLLQLVVLKTQFKKNTHIFILMHFTFQRCWLEYTPQSDPH